MNGTAVLRRAHEALRTETEGWGPAMFDWIEQILEPLGRRSTTASEDEVRAAITWCAAYLTGLGVGA